MLQASADLVFELRYKGVNQCLLSFRLVFAPLLFLRSHASLLLIAAASRSTAAFSIASLAAAAAAAIERASSLTAAFSASQPPLSPQTCHCCCCCCSSCFQLCLRAWMVRYPDGCLFLGIFGDSSCSQSCCSVLGHFMSFQCLGALGLQVIPRSTYLVNASSAAASAADSEVVRLRRCRGESLVLGLPFFNVFCVRFSHSPPCPSYSSAAACAVSRRGRILRALRSP